MNFVLTPTSGSMAYAPPPSPGPVSTFLPSFTECVITCVQ